MQTNALDDYLRQVAMYLPPWNAEEIVREIRSHVLDQAEGLAAERGVEVDESHVREALERLGSARQLAAGYVPAVALIRPEYTLPLAIYAVAATLLLVPLLVIGGLGAWLVSSLVAIGLLFAVFVALSRLPEVYRLPIWHSRLGRGYVRVDLVEVVRRGVHAIWPQPAMAATSTALPVLSAEPGLGAGGAGGAGGGGGVSGVSGAGHSQSLPRRTPTEWLIAHSGPRPLRIHELFGAGLRAVFGAALAAYFALAQTPFEILNLNFDDPQRGWRLLVQAPGLEAVRQLGMIACLATCLSGLLPIFFGKGRLGLYGVIASQIAWCVLLSRLMSVGTLLALEFTTTGWTERDWPQVHAGILSAVPLALGIGMLLTLLGLVVSLVRLGMMEAWHRSQRDLGEA